MIFYFIILRMIFVIPWPLSCDFASEQSPGESINGLGSEKNLFLYPYLHPKNDGEQRTPENHQVVILDLSLIASDVLENVTALLGRLILEFLQRMEKAYPGREAEVRGMFPVVLVLEEAHNYIPERKQEERQAVSKTIFERIAKEGRKYGLSLVVSSQSPRELSKVVLSQCNSFIVHRIQNPEDQEYIKRLLPSVSHDLLAQLPVLAQRTALIFGDCVRAPAQVWINEANPTPQSDDPQFWVHWTYQERFPDEANHYEPDFEKICETWIAGERNSAQ